MNKKRIRLAFLLAPLGPALYLIAVSLLSPSSSRYSLLMPLLFALPISYLSCLAFGVLLLKILRSHNALSAIALVAVGSLLGAVVNYLFGHLLATLLDSRTSTVPGIDVVTWGVFLGAMVAIPFALIAGIPLLPAKDGRR
jgi:membrane protein YqaA with SNARE-associated domain